MPPVEEAPVEPAVQGPAVEGPVERRTEPRPRSNAPRERRENTGNGDDGVVERRKSPPRPRKPANAVADRIDPLLAASSAALDEAEELAAAKPVRRRPPARKPATIVEPLAREVVAEPVVAEPVVAEPVVAEPAVPEPATTELPVIDDFFADPNAVNVPEAKSPAREAVVAAPPRKRPTARVPYVLPKIVPGEPEPEAEPEVVAAPEPESEAESEPKTATESVLAKIGSRITYRPQFKGVTKRLQRSLTPVVLPRHRSRVRRVTRVVRHIDTWSVFKIAVLFNIFLYAVCLTAGVMLWRVALNTGTIENIERFFESFGWQTFELKGGEIYHNAWIFGLFGVVGLTGLAVLAATMFNLITDLVGGVRVTVLEEEMVARDQRVVTWPRLLRPATPPGGRPPTKPPTPRNDPSAID